MSDEPLALLDSFLQWKLGIQRPSLKYAAMAIAKTKTILFPVNIPYPLLRVWRELNYDEKPYSALQWFKHGYR